MGTRGPELNIYALPAILTLILLVVETIFLVLFLPETRAKSLHSTRNEKVSSSPVRRTNKQSVEERIALLATLRRFHFLFLGLFSGIEFTLTFLTFDCEPCLFAQLSKHNWSHMVISTRLGQQAERDADRIHRDHQRTPSRWLCPACNCENWRGCHSTPWRLKLCHRSCSSYLHASLCVDKHHSCHEVTAWCRCVHGVYQRHGS